MMSDIKFALLLVLSVLSYLHGGNTNDDSCQSEQCINERSCNSVCDCLLSKCSVTDEIKMCSKYTCSNNSGGTGCANNSNATQNRCTLLCSDYTQVVFEVNPDCCETVRNCLEEKLVIPTSSVPSIVTSTKSVLATATSALFVMTSTIRPSPTPGIDNHIPFPLPAMVALSVMLGIFSLVIVIAIVMFVCFQRKKANQHFTRQQQSEFHWMQFCHTHSNTPTIEHTNAIQNVSNTGTRARKQTLESHTYAELTEIQSIASASYTEQGEHTHRAGLTSSPGEAAESSILPMSSKQHTYEEVNIKFRDFDSSDSGSFQSNTSTSEHNSSDPIDDHIYHVLEGPVQVNDTDTSYRHSLQPQCVTSNASTCNTEGQEAELTVASKHRDTSVLSWGDLEKELKERKEEEKEEDGEEEDVAEELQMKRRKKEEEEEKEEKEEEEEEKEEGEEGEHTLAVMCLSKEQLLASAIDYIDSEPLFDDPAYEDPLKLQASISVTKERVITATEDHDTVDKNATDVPDECLFDDPCYQTTASWQSKNVPPAQDGH